MRKDKKRKISTNKEGDKDDKEKNKAGYDRTMRSRSETISSEKTGKILSNKT